tara:strand:+ start:2352 stop:2645 length:294 start_codon:yes stop_codon:yes gene_type:complete
MIKLTELYRVPGVYDEKIKKNILTYGLREIYINQKYVMCVKENEGLQNEARIKPLVEGLHPNASYTQIALHSSTHGPATNVTVVGATKQIIEKIMVV